MNKVEGIPVNKYSFPTKRYCQTLSLRNSQDLIDTYKRMHSKESVWREIIDGIRQVGILDMDIYISGTTLTMIVETPMDFDWDKSMAILATLPRQAEWEEFMSKYQSVESGMTSDQKWKMMDRMFYLYE